MDDSRLRCVNKKIENERFDDEDNPTDSSYEQMHVEESVGKIFRHFKSRLELDNSLEEQPVLNRHSHIAFLLKGLKALSLSYECLDASRPWLCYWILHSLELLEEPLPEDTLSNVAQFLGKCQCASGGFSGGPGQDAHLAPTYAAVNALCILGTEEAYKIIDRQKLYTFLMKMRTSEGAYKMHEGGEVDIRGTYCAASAARLTNIVTPALFDGTPEWIVSCQTYEGGFGGCPGMEAHGGYSFCGLAALSLMGRTSLCDLRACLRWTANRQMRFEGGFQGRTNKLVDGCYSFWQAGAFPLFHMVCSMQDDHCLSTERWMFDHEALQEYILVCCQHQGGGLIDKPGKSRDYYHTCYCLSGLAVSQHFAGGKLAHLHTVGSQDNELKPTHPVFNIGVDAVAHANMYFNKLSLPQEPDV
ncbi:protein farnesyltransferase subunit beta-like [Pecten maximus]|uniref:protein farnesyltransferase subunit beta-like n=1 Tax=Pecten maximus TaxID=6579 RepID=UPI00145807DB|nr:protein farnesyltransferase subunit beta-like [Pecten maximus]